jgi:hypothetical protein
MSANEFMRWGVYYRRQAQVQELEARKARG